MTATVPRFGVPQLDHALSDAGRSLLIRHDPGTEARPFLHHATARWLEEGGEVVYVLADRPPSRALAGLAEDGFELGAAAGRLHFVDAHTPRLGWPEPATYGLKDLRDMDGLVALLRRAAREHPGALVVFDSLSTLADQAGRERLAAAAQDLWDALHAHRAVLALWTEWGGEAGHGLLGGFETEVRLRGIEDRIVTNQYFSVERSSGRERPSRPILYRTRRPGGVFVYIPKILVTGPFDAGKSTFVHAVSEEALSAERRGTTVALDRGHVSLNGLVAEVFGTPGQERFDPLLDTLAAQAVGVVLLVDATRPDTFPRASAMLQKVWQRGLHAIVAANKQDADGALPPQEVARRLQRPEGVAVVGCSARDPGSARAVLVALIDRILEVPA